MKRFFKLSVVLCMALLCVLLVASCSKKDETPIQANQPQALAFIPGYDGMYVGENSTYYVVSGMGNVAATEVTIPAEYMGKPVKAIAAGAFANCSSLTSITIPESVTSIGAGAFDGCTGLIQLDGGVSYVANWAVAFDASATRVTLRDGTIGIASGVFANNKDLSKVTIPASVKNISADAFTGSSKVLEKENGATYVGKWVVGCTSADEISLRDNTVGFAAKAFKEAKASMIIVPTSVKVINDWAFCGAPNIDSVVLSDKVEKIGFAAFYDSGLQGLALGKGVKSIDAQAFGSCKALNTIVVTDLKAWMGISFNGAASYPNHYGQLYFVDSEQNLITEITVPAGTETIGWRMFENAATLQKINLPASVKSISAAAFKGCEALTEITIPASVTQIEEQTFYGCASLTRVVIPAGVQRICSKAFENCYNLVEVCNLSNLTITAGSADNGSIGLYAREIFTSANAASKLSVAGDYVYYVNGETVELLAYVGTNDTPVLPVDYNGASFVVGENVFRGRTIDSVIIPKNLTAIADGMLASCTALATVYYGGTAEEWAEVTVGDGNEVLETVLICYYSETQPTDKTAKYWHFVIDDITPIIWEPATQAPAA